MSLKKKFSSIEASIQVIYLEIVALKEQRNNIWLDINPEIPIEWTYVEHDRLTKLILKKERARSILKERLKTFN